MPTAHRIHHDLYDGPKTLDDPGDGGVIRAVEDLSICEMVSGTVAESRTLANPSKPGLRLVLRMVTNGGGAITVTAANGLTVSLSTSTVFNAVGDMLSLISVTHTVGDPRTYRWQTEDGNVGVTIA